MRLRLVSLAALAWAPAPAAMACTLCHGETAERVRASLLGPDLLGQAAAVAAPIPLLLAAIYAFTRMDL